MRERIIQWLSQHMQPCIYKTYLGIECPGCGAQRSLLRLLEGDVVASFELYPALLFILATLLMLGIHLIFKLKNGAIILKNMGLGTVVVILINYFFKIVFKIC